MKRFLSFIGLLILPALILFALYPSTPTPPARPAAQPNQAERARHLELAIIYERSDLLDKARDEYALALSADSDALTNSARAGLERVLARQQDWIEQARKDALAILISAIKVALALVLLIPFAQIGVWLIRRVAYREGYVLTGFDDLTSDKIGDSLTQLVHATMQEIRLVHEPTSDIRAMLLAGTGLPGIASATSADSITLPSFGILMTSGDALSESFTTISAINLGSANVPLGQIASIAQRLLKTRRYTIAGKIIRLDNTLQVTATLYDRRAQTITRIWRESASIDNKPGAALAQIARALAYRILFDLSVSTRAPTWRNLADFTDGLNQLRAYRDDPSDAARLRDTLAKFQAASASEYIAAQFYSGLLHNLLGQYPAAIEIFRAMIDRTPELKAEIAYNLGVAYYQQFHDLAQGNAESEFQSVLSATTPTDPRADIQQLRALAHCGLAVLYADRRAGDAENLTLARQHIDAARASYEAPLIHALTLVALGIADQRNDRCAEAIQSFQAALRAQPDHPTALVNLGVAYLQNNQPQLAVEILERTTRLNPDHEYAFYKLGQALRAAEEPVRAMDAFVRAPHIADAHNDRGELLAAEQDYSAALAEFRQAIALNRKIASAHANLAWWLIESGECDSAALDEATKHARQAAQLARGSVIEWRWRDVLGRVYLARKEWADAEKELLHSIQLKADAIQNRYHLAQVYHASERMALAREQLVLALALPEKGMWRERAAHLMRALAEKKN